MTHDPRIDWSRRLMTIAQAGLTYARDPFDLERYRELREIAVEMTADVTALSREIVRLAYEAERGYFTPKIDVRAFVQNERGEVLLVRETVDDRWSLPGGWADPGESLRENAVREVREETGFDVEAAKLLAVYDKAKHEHPPEILHCYKAFVLCRLAGGERRTSHETSDVGFFARGGAPELSTPRVTAAQLERMFDLAADPSAPTDFD